MSITKMLKFFILCIGINVLLVTGQCPTVKVSEKIAYEKLAGHWHGRYLSNDLLKHINNLDIIITYEQNKGLINASANSGGTPINFRGTYDVSADGSPDTNARFTFDILTGTYTLLSDYKCYLFVHGCPAALNGGESTILYFRDNNPSKECENSGVATVKNTGFDFGKVALDPTSSSSG
ncbi:hypothetical protein C0J52_03365 [Blattella germanica]|nr:hypothetical protein C0J52_03365 [Blattella germanica]